MSATEILEELPKLTEAERRAVRERLVELAAENEDVRLCDLAATEGARLLDAMEEEVWVVDFGLAAKVRPALLLTGSPADDELDLVTVLLHTTALRGNQCELAISKPFLKPGAFHLQQLQTVSTVKLERRLGALTPDEMERVDREVARQLGLSRDPTIISSAD